MNVIAAENKKVLTVKKKKPKALNNFTHETVI